MCFVLQLLLAACGWLVVLCVGSSGGFWVSGRTPGASLRALCGLSCLAACVVKPYTGSRRTAPGSPSSRCGFVGPLGCFLGLFGRLLGSPAWGFGSRSLPVAGLSGPGGPSVGSGSVVFCDSSRASYSVLLSTVGSLIYIYIYTPFCLDARLLNLELGSRQQLVGILLQHAQLVNREPDQVHLCPCP